MSWSVRTMMTACVVLMSLSFLHAVQNYIFLPACAKRESDKIQSDSAHRSGYTIFSLHFHSLHLRRTFRFRHLISNSFLSFRSFPGFHCLVNWQVSGKFDIGRQVSGFRGFRRFPWVAGVVWRNSKRRWNEFPYRTIKWSRELDAVETVYDGNIS